MEEKKLYFKPEKYGMGKKKSSAESQEDKANKSQRNHKIRNLVLFLFFLLIIILIIIWLLRGKTTTSGQYPENVKNESLECVASGKGYEKIQSVSSEEKEIKIAAVFHGNEELSSIDLRYKLNLKDESEAVSAEAVSHAELNIGLQRAGFSPGMFNNKFTIIRNTLTISLHAIKNDLNDFARPYFLLASDTGEAPSTLEEYRKTYEGQGFTCKTSKE